MPEDRLQRLRARQSLKQPAFRSPTPVIGPLISRLRLTWHVLTTRWIIQSLIDQQNAFNQGVVEQFEISQEERLQVYEEWLAQLDREHAELVHDLGELRVELARERRLRVELEQRIATGAGSETPADRGRERA